MRRLHWLARSVALSAFLLAPHSGSARAGDRDEGPPIALFNGKDLTGWTIFVDPKTQQYAPESRSDRVFQVQGGILHVSGERFGGLTSREEYDNYHLTIEFKWGQKKWPPREKETDRRDSGVLLHCIGPPKIWPKSIECQIQEHDCGDFWLVDGTTIQVDGQTRNGRVIKKQDAEKPRGEWNTIEVICDGDKITNIVNGVVVNEGTGASVTRGRILLQSEGAEVFYRKVELRPLTKRK